MLARFASLEDPTVIGLQPAEESLVTDPLTQFNIESLYTYRPSKLRQPGPGGNVRWKIPLPVSSFFPGISTKSMPPARPSTTPLRTLSQGPER